MLQLFAPSRALRETDLIAQLCCQFASSSCLPQSSRRRKELKRLSPTDRRLPVPDPSRRMYRPATITLNAIEFALPKNLNVAYVPGVGDNVEPMLEEMGVPVTVVEPEQIPTVDLSKFTTVVVGPRAYQASQILRDNNTYLLEYVKNGGRLVVQYGQYEL